MVPKEVCICLIRPTAVLRPLSMNLATKSISHDQINAILEDTTGVLWIGTKDGLNKFDESTGTFVRYMANETKENALSHNLITSLYLDREGLIWIGTDGEESACLILTTIALLKYSITLKIRIV